MLISLLRYTLPLLLFILAFGYDLYETRALLHRISADLLVLLEIYEESERDSWGLAMIIGKFHQERTSTDVVVFSFRMK
jgi:hypothetical protein